MKSIAEAQQEVLDRLRERPKAGSAGCQQVPLHEATGRILAAEVVAGVDSPRFDTAAMDGFVVHAADSPGTLPITATMAAGAAPAALARGEAGRIMTGAPLPTASKDGSPGAGIAIWEDCAEHRDDDGRTYVRVPAVPPGQHIRRRGEDIAVGSSLLSPGTTLTASDVFVLASQGLEQVPVFPRPVVAILSTGDELVALGQPLAAGKLYDCNSHGLAALAHEAGCHVRHLGAAPDTLPALTEMLAQADADALLVTGGVSGSERDLVREALQRVGAELVFWKVAMKPGKPFAFAMRDAMPIFALPGNPVSAATSFELFVRPALRKLAGANDCHRPQLVASLRGGYRKDAGRAHVLRVALSGGAPTPVAVPHPKQGSGMLSSLLQWDATLVLDADVTEVAADALVQVGWRGTGLAAAPGHR